MAPWQGVPSRFLLPSRRGLPGQVGVVRPGPGGATPRAGSGGAAQLRAGAVRADVQAGGGVLQRAVRLRDELLPPAGVGGAQHQAVLQPGARRVIAGVRTDSPVATPFGAYSNRYAPGTVPGRRRKWVAGSALLAAHPAMTAFT